MLSHRFIPDADVVRRMRAVFAGLFTLDLVSALAWSSNSPNPDHPFEHLCW